jgi:hypothetical protein
MVVYASLARAIPLGSIYYVLKWWSRNVRTKLHKKLTMWSAVQSEWNGVVKGIVQNAPVSLCAPKGRDMFVVTDACGENNTIAGILVDGETLIYFAEGRNEVLRSISSLETLAVERAVELWGRRMKGRMIHLLCDNTVTLVALARGFSPVFEINGMVLRIRGELDKVSAGLELWYVRSQENPADPLTRGNSATKIHKSVLDKLRWFSDPYRSPKWVEGFDEKREEFWEGSNLPIKRWINV